MVEFKCVGKIDDVKDAYITLCALTGVKAGLVEDWERIGFGASIARFGAFTLCGREGQGNYKVEKDEYSLGYMERVGGSWFIYVRKNKVERWGKWEYYALYPNSEITEFRAQHDGMRNALVIECRNMETVYE